MDCTTHMGDLTSEVVTASHMNTHVRDNLLETAPGKAGLGFVLGTASNTIAVRQPGYARINTSETTASTSYGNLATTGPSVTTTTNTAAIIIVGAAARNNTADEDCFMGVDVSGATTLSPSNVTCYIVRNETRIQATYAWVESGLTAGSNTFKAEYRVSGGTGTWSSRGLTVIPSN